MTARPSAPARPAARKAPDGPPASIVTPARAAPAAEPIDDAVAAQANASVALPAGEAPSSIVEALAFVGAIAAPARTSSAPSAHGLPAPRTRAPWPAASAPNTTANRPAVRAPPPRLVTTAPPISEPRPHRANNGPAVPGLPAARVAAVTPTSTAPMTRPNDTYTSTSARTPGERRAPPRPAERAAGAGAAGRGRRAAGWAANASVPLSTSTATTAIAAPVDARRPTPMASGGPASQVSSSAAASAA